MHDLHGAEIRRYRAVTETFRRICEGYAYREISTPVLEHADVFNPMGETSDVVTRETYTFDDRGGDPVTLRPEATAGIVRAFISEGMSQSVPCKLFSYGPMFRYERPQKGRTRQFHQINVELIGIEEPAADIEVIAIADDLLKALDISDKATLKLNTLGDPESRLEYRQVLVEYLRDHEASLSEDSLSRLAKNPLRVLDSKDESDKVIVAKAPRMQDHLNDLSQDFFAETREGLENLGISYELDDQLVRGLDYYCHTVFEFVSSALGAQDAVMGGGRYDGLIKAMGGPQTPGVGWGCSFERLNLLVPELEDERRTLALVPVGPAAEKIASVRARSLREAGYVVDLGYRGNLKRRMQRANRIDAVAALIFGEEELKKDVVTVRDLGSGEQQEVRLDDLDKHLLPYR